MWGDPPHVTSSIWGPPPPSQQALILPWLKATAHANKSAKAVPIYPTPPQGAFIGDLGKAVNAPR